MGKRVSETERERDSETEGETRRGENQWERQRLGETETGGERQRDKEKESSNIPNLLSGVLLTDDQTETFLNHISVVVSSQTWKSLSCMSKSQNQHPATHLQISVHNVVFMQVTQSRDDLGTIESGTLFRKDPLSRQVEKEFSPIDVLHHKTQSVWRLE